MKNNNNILSVSLWSGLIIGIVISMGFVNTQQEKLLCESIDIKINQNDELYFLSREDIEQLILDRADSIVNHPKALVYVQEIENKLNSHDDIANAEVYLTIDGKLKVKVKQRKPIVRVINRNGESYYIDNEGKLMPLSNKYTAKVLVANGDIMEPYVKHYEGTVSDNVSDRKVNQLADLYAMASYILADEFWKAQVRQIYINRDKDMELVPMVGKHKIIFGDTIAMDQKFKKLLTFYQEGLNTTGWWDKYTVINLKYKNQIVCTKKK